MIYKETFREFLERNLSPVKERSKNYVCRCPYCEIGVKKNHYHLWISKEVPIFHCFHCEEGGTLKKLFQKIEGVDKTEKYVESSRIKSEKKIYIPEEREKLVLPELREDLFPLKSMYLRKRIGFSTIPLSSIKGLIFDIEEFIRLNNILLPANILSIRNFLQTNFIGFVTEHSSKLVLRNIEQSSEARYFQVQIRETDFLDYYKICGGNILSNQVVIGEGIFDVLVESLYDSTGLKNQTSLYASCLSKSFTSLLKSLVFNEQIFKLRVVVLSDRDVKPEFYRKLRNDCSSFLESLTIYYNKSSKDFGELPLTPVRYF